MNHSMEMGRYIDAHQLQLSYLKASLDKDRLEIERDKAVDAMKSIRNRITSIGGPLNDNCGEYSQKQRQIFHSIIEDIEYSCLELDKD